MVQDFFHQQYDINNISNPATIRNNRFGYNPPTTIGSMTRPNSSILSIIVQLYLRLWSQHVWTTQMAFCPPSQVSKQGFENKIYNLLLPCSSVSVNINASTANKNSPPPRSAAVAWGKDSSWVGNETCWETPWWPVFERCLLMMICNDDLQWCIS